MGHSHLGRDGRREHTLGFQSSECPPLQRVHTRTAATNFEQRQLAGERSVDAPSSASATTAEAPIPARERAAGPRQTFKWGPCKQEAALADSARHAPFTRVGQPGRGAPHQAPAP